MKNRVNYQIGREKYAEMNGQIFCMYNSWRPQMAVLKRRPLASWEVCLDKRAQKKRPMKLGVRQKTSPDFSKKRKETTNKQQNMKIFRWKLCTVQKEESNGVREIYSM